MTFEFRSCQCYAGTANQTVRWPGKACLRFRSLRVRSVAGDGCWGPGMGLGSLGKEWGQGNGASGSSFLCLHSLHSSKREVGAGSRRGVRSVPNQPAAGRAGIASRLAIEHHWPGVPIRDVRRNEAITHRSILDVCTSVLPYAGMGVIALMVIVWFAQGHKSDEWPAFAWTLFAGMILAGVLFCCLAVLSSDKTMKKWIASSGTHEAGIIVAILAAPVYWTGRLFQGTEGDDEIAEPVGGANSRCATVLWRRRLHQIIVSSVSRLPAAVAHLVSRLRASP